MSDDLFAQRRAALDEPTGFVVAAVAEALDTVAALRLQNAGGETVHTRDGDYKSWDPDVFRVDKDVEDGFRRRLAELNQPLVFLSEEAGRVMVGPSSVRGDGPSSVRGDPVYYAVADPFDGSWLFKRGIPDFWYSSLALYDASFEPVCCAVGDAVHRTIAFADRSGAYLTRLVGNGLSAPLRLDAAYRHAHGRPDVTDPAAAGIESYAMKPGKFLLPLVDRCRPVVEPFKFFLPNGGPFGFVDVALGCIDVYFAPGQPYVDVFSGLMIARQAGAVVTGFDGRPVRPGGDPETLWNVVASTNPELHDKVLALIRTCS